MSLYSCRLPGFDQVNCFTMIEADNVVDAAEKYAERCNYDSAGDLYALHTEHTFEVICPERGSINVTVEIDYKEIYTGRTLELKRKAA